MQGNVAKRNKSRNSTGFPQGKELPSAIRLSLVMLRVETLKKWPEVEFLTIGKKIEPYSFIKVIVHGEEDMNVTKWREKDHKQTLSFDISSITKADKIPNALEKIPFLWRELFNETQPQPNTLVIQTIGGDDIKQMILKFAVKLLGVKESIDLIWKRYQTKDGKKAVLAFTVGNKNEQPAVEQNTTQAVSPPPAPPAPPPLASIADMWRPATDKDKATYRKCVQSGEKRVEQMHRQMRLEESVRNERQTLFDNDYITYEIAHPDSPTGEALCTVWKQAPSDQFSYKNTPRPEEGEILSWENQRSSKEKLNNSDIYFCQLILAKEKLRPGVECPPLKSLKRQQASAKDTVAVCNCLSENMKKAAPSGTWKLGEDQFNALLGTANGTGPVFLVLDNGVVLGIGNIESIELLPNRNTIFYFSERKPT